MTKPIQGLRARKGRARNDAMLGPTRVSMALLERVRLAYRVWVIGEGSASKPERKGALMSDWIRSAVEERVSADLGE